MTRQEQIKEAAAEYCLMYGIGDLFDTMANFKEGAEWADQHPHWIPVEERLPEENEEVLAYNAESEEIIACWPEVFNESTTHWMPLPAAPRKEE